MDVRFEVECTEDGTYSVRPHVDGVAEKIAVFDADDTNERFQEQLERIEDGLATRDDLLNVGSVLWNAICEQSLRDRIADVAAADADTVFLRIDLPVDGGLDDLPWEAVVDTKLNRFLAGEPRYAVVRTPPRDVVYPAWPRAHEGRVRMLVVVPEGSGLQVGFERLNLDRLAQSCGNFEVKVLGGKVTIEALDKKLDEEPWDILHYIGHGECTADGKMKITFNTSPNDVSDGTIDALTFAQALAKRKLQLVVMNCCEGAAPGGSRINAGVGPHLMRTARIPAVVAMRYAIDDRDAIAFANAFYGELFNGRNPGRVDVAVQAARHTLQINPEYSQRGFATPVLYVEKGREQLFTFATKPVQPPKKKRNLDLPSALIDAFSARPRLVIPIVGPGLHTPDTARRVKSAVSTLLDMVRTIADDCQYPERGEIEFAETAGDGFLSVVMSRVFQHSQRVQKQTGLLKKLAATCTRDGVPEVMLSIASWDVPGYVYTHFDGLMHEALTHKSKHPCVLNVIDRNDTTKKDPPVLLNLRGTLQLDQPTLSPRVVLTDRDHEQRFDELTKPIPDIFNLLTGGGDRALLFLGVSPRDPLVRRLCSQHLDNADNSIQGPRFFVHPTEEPADEAYWQPFDVTWIRESPCDVIETLTQLEAE